MTTNSEEYLGPRDKSRLALTYRPVSEVESRIFLLDVDTGELRRFSSPPAGIDGDFYGEYSPDGDRIAFFRAKTPPRLDSDLYIQPLSGGEAQPLTNEHFQAVSGLAWMPNGEEIIFSAGPQEKELLWRVDVSGGKPKPILGSGENLRRQYPAVSQNGRRLAYNQVKTWGSTIWRFPNPRVSNSTEAPRCLVSSSRWDGGALPSPDGSRILFVSDRTGRMELYLCNSDGTQQRPLTDRKAYCGASAWSPDGRQICFDGQVGTNFDLFLMNPDGSNIHQLTDHPATDATPSWSRDGKWIYFASNRTGRFETWKVPAAGGEPLQVTHQGGFKAQESEDGFLYYTKGEVGEIWKTAPGRGEETPVLQQKLYWWYWALSSDGIYFITLEKAAGGQKPVIHFLDLQSGTTVHDVLTLDLLSSSTTIELSPDGRWFLFSVQEPSGAPEIMLVENFR